MTKKTGRRRIYLMRHGHVDYFAPGLTDFRSVPLTPEGQQQAVAAGDALSKMQFDAVFHSGLPRTKQTTSLVLGQNEHWAEQGIGLQAPGLEEIRGGTFVTDSKVELAARLAYSFDIADQPEASFLPEGEKFSEAYARVVSGFEALLLDASWATALVVAHEGVNRMILGYMCGAGLSGISHFEQDLCCINVLDIDVVPDGAGLAIERKIIKAINVTPYDYIKSNLPKTSLEHLFDIDLEFNRPSFTN